MEGKQPIVLQPIREWQEKGNGKVLKTIRLYVGSFHVATVEPTKEDPNLYYCHDMTDLFMTTSSAEPLEDIKMNIELSIKEFIAKVAKPRKLVMTAQPSKRFHSPLKKDGNGKR